MSNRIRSVTLQNDLPDPAEAEVWVCVLPEQVTPTTEVRGRLVGPHCRYASTVEVAYPLRPFARPPAGLSGVVYRVVIPEPCLWEPESPFLYEGPVELWEEGRLSDRVAVRLGLRSVTLGPRGLRLNGRPFTVRGLARAALTEEEAPHLRRAGYNTLLAPVGPQTGDLCEAADRLGFFVLGRLTGDEETVKQAGELASHPSCLGWVLGPEVPTAEEADLLTRTRAGVVLGLELDRIPPIPLPPGVRFLVCEARQFPTLAWTDLPRIVRLGPGEEAREKELLSSPDVLGWLGEG